VFSYHQQDKNDDHLISLQAE